MELPLYERLPHSVRLSCCSPEVLNDLKEKKIALKKAEKEVTSLEAKKAKEDAKVAEEAKKAEAESVVKRLLASGMSTDEILERLK